MTAATQTLQVGRIEPQGITLPIEGDDAINLFNRLNQTFLRTLHTQRIHRNMRIPEPPPAPVITPGTG